MSYVTGRHSLKVGYQGTLMTDDRTWYRTTHDLWYRFNNGIPNQLTQTISTHGSTTPGPDGMRSSRRNSSRWDG